jgi:undecaprenyl-diphosphatase
MIEKIDSLFFFFNQKIANPVCDEIIRFFMQIPGALIIVLIGAIALFAGKKYLRFTALVSLSSFVIAKYAYKTIKDIVQRPRPFHALDEVRLLLGPNDGFSFPSGHATISFCIATVIAMRYPKTRYPMFFAALLVALSRPYIGVHYPSDILGGSILGILVGYFVTKAANECES